MALNSKREQIIEAIKAEIESISSITTVERRLPSYEDLESFALTQFPVIAIVSGLPVPVAHNVERVPGGRDVFISELTLSLYCYFQERVDPDSTLSNLLDDLWAKLYADTTKEGLVLSTDLSPIPHQDFWDPFYAFKLDVVVKYKHLIGGI